MVDIATASGVVVTVSVVIGVVFTVLELRHLARTRRTDIIMRVYQEFSRREWVENIVKVSAAKFESFDDYTKKYGITEVLQVATLFDGVGVLLQQGLIDIDLVDNLFGNSVNLMWARTRPVIHGIRESAKEQGMFSHFEYLHERLSAYRKEDTNAR